MGDAEVAAYVVSRDGTGDLYAHANTSVPHTQACMAWALVLLRHPLLASCVVASHILYTRPETLAARRALCAARVEDARVAANNPGLGLGIVIPHRAAPVPLGVLDPDAPAPPAAPRCLLTLTVSEPTYSSDVDSVLVGARMPPGEVGVHAYVAGGKLTLSLAYDVNGAVEGWWADVLGLVSDVLLQ
ncbi:hypothetical protein CcaverHIS631_0411730 [Cutaneotrichosporon cavernicola]|nr:hypothetical protein CcaverHIS631_0411730 [Cutaneotrichosporon cavernicola]